MQVKSISDVITNSSNEAFILVKDNNLDALKAIEKDILDFFGDTDEELNVNEEYDEYYVRPYFREENNEIEITWDRFHSQDELENMANIVRDIILNHVDKSSIIKEDWDEENQN